jgi:hypothetical protein
MIINNDFEQSKFTSEVSNLSKVIAELHHVLNQLASVNNEPKTGELRLIRSKLKDSRELLEYIQKELLKKDDLYQEQSKKLKQQYQDKKNGQKTDDTE